jgi:hypothetical protein
MNDARFWINKLTRYVYVSNSAEDAARAVRMGFTEATGAEIGKFLTEWAKTKGVVLE